VPEAGVLTVERPREFTRQDARYACARCRGLLLADVLVGDLCGGCGAELEVVRARPGTIRHQDPRPEWLEALELYGGVNRFGGLNVRVVWSNSRSFISGGEWFERSVPIFGEAAPGETPPLLGFHWLDEFELKNFDVDKTTYRWVVKDKRVRYHDEIEERWVFEVWHDAPFYGDVETWDAEALDVFTGKLAIAQFPARGDYEHYWTCETKQGGYLTPTREIVRYVCHLVRAGRALKARPQFKATLRKERDLEKKRRQEKADSDYVDATYNSPRLVPFSSGYGQKSKGRKAHLL
jgi:hypothetical protein